MLAPKAHKPLGIARRYFITLSASSFRSVMTFAASLLLARDLGPESYGTMLFLLGVSMAIRQLLDCGSGSAFFTFLCQRQRSNKFVGLYFAWIAVQLVVPLLCMLFLLPSSWLDVVWKGHGKELSALAFAASFAQNGIWPTMIQMGESQRATRWVQAVGAVVVLFNLVAIAIFYLTDLLEIKTVFALTIVEYLCAAFVAFRGLSFPPAVETEDPVEVVFQEYWKYCRPLVIYSWLGFLFSLSDAWLLQHYGGSQAQAYFGLGSQFALFAAILVGAAQNILWKEVAEAKYLGQLAEMAKQYRKLSRILYLVSAAIGGFFIFWSTEIIGALWGPDYVAGANAFAVMCLYPAQLAMGQIETTVLLATGRGRIQSVVGIWFIILSMIAAYFLLASPDSILPGLGLADVGMSVKMVGMAMLQVNILAFLNSRFLGLQYDWFHQVVCVASVLSIGAFSSFVGQNLLPLMLNQFWVMGISFSLYLVLMVALLLTVPWLAGCKREELYAHIR